MPLLTADPLFTADTTGTTAVQDQLVAQATAAAAAGLPLMIPPGDYLITTAPTTLPVGVTLWAPTRGARFIADKPGPLLWIPSGVTLKGLTFRNEEATDPDAGILNLETDSTDVLIEDCRFEGDITAGLVQSVVIDAAGCRDITIRRNSFEGGAYGILTNTGANDLTGLTVENNVFTEIRGDVMEFNHPSGSSPAVSGIRVRDNMISLPPYSGAGSGTGFAIGVAGVRDATITGNTIVAARREAIHIEDDSHAITITANTIKNVDNTGGSGDTSGIAIYPGCSDITVADNTIENVVGGACITTIYDASAVLVSNVAVTGNVLRDAVVGVDVAADTTEGGRFLIADNLLYNCASGILVGGDFDEIVVHDNLITGSSTVGIGTGSGTTGKIRSYRGNIFTNCALDYTGSTTGNSVIIPDRAVLVSTSPASVVTEATVPLFRLGHHADGLVKFQARRIGQASTRIDTIYRVRWNGTTLVTHPLMTRSNGVIDVSSLKMVNGVLNAVVYLGTSGVTVECSAGFEGLCSEDSSTYATTVTPTTMNVTGSRSGNAALANLLTALAAAGFITDSTT